MSAVEAMGCVAKPEGRSEECLRRELNHDVTPPRVVRRVRRQRCLRRRRPFWSADVVRLRLCDSGGDGCRYLDERYAGGP